MRAAQQATFYFSFRSPYSWLAYHDLMTGHRDVAGRLAWIPFWEPDELSLRMLTEAGGQFPYVENSRPKARYILADVRRLARRRGLALAWPVDRRPWWEPSHLAYLAARRLGRGPEYIASVYRARWEQGRDISDPVTVAAVAEEIGVCPGDLADAAGDPALRAQGLEALLSIYENGVFGVPFFVLSHDKFWGVDRLADFIAAWHAAQRAEPGGGSATGRTASERAEAGAADTGPWPGSAPLADQGHAGGCG